MPLKKELIVLNRIGLNASQARIYLALVQFGQLKVAEISKLSGVHRGDAYRTLSQLQNMGLIQKMLTTPTMYEAVPIEIGLNILIQRKTAEIAETETEIIEIIRKYKRISQKRPTFESGAQFVLVPENEAAIQRILKMTKRCQKSIDSIFTLNMALDSEPLLMSRFRRLLERGVKSRIVIDEAINPEIVKSIDFGSANLRIRIPTNDCSSDIYMAIFDKKEIIFYTSKTKHLAKSPQLWSNNPFMVNFAQTHFDKIWKKAKPLTTTVQQ